MSFHWSFRFTPFEPRQIPDENQLFESIRRKESELCDALWLLGWLYTQTGRQPEALQVAKRILALARGPEMKAWCCLAMGQVMEQMADYPAAITYYSEAFSLEPAHTETWYFINNNLGFCLNTLGRYREGEVYCRNAISIDPGRSNAFKNLGISREGQGDYVQAADAYMAAIRANACDPRALQHLEELYRRFPESMLQIPEFEAKLAKCREAVRAGRR